MRGITTLPASGASPRRPASRGRARRPHPGESTAGRRTRAGLRPTPGAASARVERLLELSLPAVPASCPRARHEVTAAVQGLGVAAAAVQLAVSEAVTNVVLHAYRDAKEGTEAGRIHLNVTAGAADVWVLVADDGVGMRPRDDSPGVGLGLAVIASASDELSIVEGEPGTRVSMRFASRKPRVEGPR